jgi:hypothetical protein
LDKGVISRIYKELQKLNTKRTNKLIDKWANKSNRQFSKEGQMTDNYVKKRSTSLGIKEMQIKMTLRFHLILVRMAFVKRRGNIVIGENVNQGSHYGNQYGGSSKD